MEAESNSPRIEEEKEPQQVLEKSQDAIRIDDEPTKTTNI